MSEIIIIFGRTTQLYIKLIINHLQIINNMSFGGQQGYGGGNQGVDDVTQLASMHMMMGIMKTCFGDCITDFRSSDLSTGEKTCL